MPKPGSAASSSFKHTLPAETIQEELAALVNALNADETVHGILVQLPLPKHLDAQCITLASSPVALMPDQRRVD
ncbi:hypothetical protein GV67_10915 [Pseudorhizobium pelagicum]|uniref:Tetrahydrofolate dehydrogenase/cyclohydrolase catalytic domain-containing protein n=1 Tax=Pseudorhizobium pelagicum TaxID=1509405 RepID=A0A922P1H4_9HYPH|nr:hypothetical protein GV67_10915 [Pseudorhizobium pelagicum]KEQ04458.1 hypothetical protein GV68_13365 [Pseudorhizobium pelagicum]